MRKYHSETGGGGVGYFFSDKDFDTPGLAQRVDGRVGHLAEVLGERSAPGAGTCPTTPPGACRRP